MERASRRSVEVPPFMEALVARGCAEGRLSASRALLLRLLARAGLSLDEEAQRRIARCEDAETLCRWAEQVLGATRLAEVFAGVAEGEGGEARDGGAEREKAHESERERVRGEGVSGEAGEGVVIAEVPLPPESEMSETDKWIYLDGPEPAKLRWLLDALREGVKVPRRPRARREPTTAERDRAIAGVMARIEALRTKEEEGKEGDEDSDGKGG